MRVQQSGSVAGKNIGTKYYVRCFVLAALPVPVNHVYESAAQRHAHSYVSACLEHTPLALHHEWMQTRSVGAVQA
jgi:hypothetical protein